jgi:GntR family transcriptional regulator
VDFNANKSIFLQIAESISEKILDGTFPPESRIPSVRDMASELGVNPNTIMRAFTELQSANIIENKRGIGYFLTAQSQELILDRKRNEFFEILLPELIRKANQIGISITELNQHIKKLNNENQ